MNLVEYQAWTDTVAVYPEHGTGSVAEIMYLALGLNGEVAEWAGEEYGELRKGYMLSTAAARSELGDCHWYATRLARYVGLDLSTMDITGTRQAIKELIPNGDKGFVRSIEADALIIAGKIANHAKKLHRDGHSPALKEKIAHELLWLFAILDEACEVGWNCKLSMVLDENVKKLEHRKKNNELHGSGIDGSRK
jgi:NTP pyrophosphatase (non-canonical NTP hydrolase)